jgi:hypothetical protein
MIKGPQKGTDATGMFDLSGCSVEKQAIGEIDQNVACSSSRVDLRGKNNRGIPIGRRHHRLRYEASR